MANIIDHDKMLKKYRYLTQTTESAKKKMLPEKELPCIVCGKPITLRDVDTDNCQANINKGSWIWMHTSCISQGQSQ